MSEPEDAVADVSLHEQIATEIVQVYRAAVDRTPSSATAYWAGADILVVVIDGTFDAEERERAAAGEHKALRDVRTARQYGAVEAFCEPIERLTGRKVRAFLSAVDTAEGTSSETFVLHPRGYVGPSRIDIG